MLLTRHQGILDIEDAYHAQQYAIARVDVIGHSMGGLVSRYFASQPEYLSVDNYYKGYIHRLVTIGTPHLGAGEPQAYYGFYLECLYEQNPTALLFIKVAKLIGMRPGLAYRDLSPLSAASSRLANPTSGAIPAYAEVGSAGSWGGAVSWIIDYFINKDAAAGPNKQKQQPNWVWLNGSVWNNSQSSDACVSEDSQMGGLPPSWITITNGLKHASSVPAPLTAEERSNTIGSDIVNQLYADNFAPGGFPCPPTADPNDNVAIPSALTAFDPFPALQVDPHGLSYPPSTIVPSVTMQNEITSIPAASVSSPVPGQVFAPGDTITVSLAPNNANPLSSAVVAVAQDDGTIIGMMSITSAPFTATFTIPQTTVGNVNIAAATWDNQDNVAETNLGITVQTTATIQSITASPSSLTLTGVGDSVPLQVTGTFSDGVQRDITSYQTTYSSSNTAVATVDTNGNVTAVATGVAQITATYDGAIVTIPVTVNVQAPDIAAVQPLSAQAGQVVSLRLDGRNFGGATGIQFLLPSGQPDPNISVSNLALSPDGTTLNSTVTIAAVCPSETDKIVVTAAGGSSDPASGSDHDLFTVVATVPATPTSLTATPADGQVALSWAASTGAISYNVYQATSSGAEGSTPVATGTSGTTTTITGLTNGTTYYFKVAAVNTAGASAQSPEATATPNPSPTFSGEKAWDDGTNFLYQVTYSGTYSSFQVFLDTDNNAATGYTINGIGADYMIENGWVYKSTANGSSWSWAHIGSATLTFPSSGTVEFECPLTVIGPPASAKVDFRELTSNWIGTNDPTLVTFTGSQTLVTPTNLKATVGNTQLALSWTGSAWATSYNLYRSTTKGGEGTTPYQTGITSTSFTDTGLTNGTAYYYTVAAVNSTGISGQSSEAEATPNPPPAFSGEKAWSDGTNFYYEATYSGVYSHFQAFLDTDNNAATGYTINGIGADYMIQDGWVYQSTANGSSWNWTRVGSATLTLPSSGTVQFVCPLSTIGSPPSAKVEFTVRDANWVGTNDPNVIAYP